jgi:hypothetical protein
MYLENINIFDELNKFIAIFNEHLKSEKYEEALECEAFVFNNLLKISENPEFFSHWDNHTYKSKNIAISKYRTSSSLSINNKKYVFIIHQKSLLAHEKSLLTILKFLKKYNSSFKFFIVYLMETPSDSTNTHELFYEGLIDKFYFLANNSYDLKKQRKQFIDLKKSLGPCKYFVISIIPNLFHTLLIAKNEKIYFIGMKHYPKHLDTVTKWIAGGRNNSLIKINNQPWHTIDFPPLKINSENNFSSNINYFGSISRIEKIKNANFLTSISKILSQSNNSKFIYTSRNKEDSYVLSFFQSKNLNLLSENIGYIDPNLPLYWNSLKLYAEPFPFGGGLMLNLAICNSTPVVYLRKKEFLQLSIADDYIKRSLQNYYDDFRELCCASNEDEYIKKSINFLTKKEVFERFMYVINGYKDNMQFNEKEYSLELSDFFLNL